MAVSVLGTTPYGEARLPRVGSNGHDLSKEVVSRTPSKPTDKMKKTALLLIVGLASTVLAQTPINQQVISSGPGWNTNGNESLMVTNPAGGAFPISQLDAQLTTLKADVERTLPMLSAVINRASPSQVVTSRSQELANAASNFIAHALGHETNSNSTVPSGGASPRMTNFAGFLRSLISTNTGGGGGVSFDPSTLNQLANLQRSLEPVLNNLNTLNISSIPGTNQLPGGFTQPLTPTGR